MIGKFLDDIGTAAVPLPQLDEADDVAVQPGHLVDARQRPLGEVGAEREQTEVGMLRWGGELQTHRSAPLVGLDLVPQRVERCQAGGSEVDAATGRQRLDGGEPRPELGGGAAEGQLGVGAGVPRHVDDGEQEVAELAGDVVRIASYDRRAHLVELLADLVQRATDVVPVEAHLGCLALQLLGVRERRLGGGDAVEDRMALLLVHV